ncbi:sphingoid long chain base kinase 4 [Monosporozyma servazzii]
MTSPTMSFTYSKHNRIRASLTTDGIRIKSQFQSYDNGGDNENIGCIACFSSQSSRSLSSLVPEDNFVIPNGTLIPFGRIISAKYLNKQKVSLSGNSKSIHKSQTHEHTSLLDSQDPNHTSSANDDSLYEDSLYDDIENLEEGTTFNKSLIELTFVHPRGKNIVPTKLTLLMDPLPTETTSVTNTPDLVSYIIEKSYQNVHKEKSILIIINPHGGAGKALTLFNELVKPILDSSPFINYEVVHTKYYQHAIDIARDMDITKFDTVACCSGDGIPNEVINGFYQRTDRSTVFNKVCVTQLPCGSGNAMSVSCHWTMNPSYSTLCLLKSVESRIDLMCCQQPSYVDESPRLSFLSQTMGVIAESDINTEFIRWMGPVRFDIGVAFNIFQSKKYPCDLYVKYAAKTKKQLNIHYKQNKSKGQLLFTPTNSQVSINKSKDNNNSAFVQEKFPIKDTDLDIKYSIKDPIPSDWEKIDSEVTDNLSIFYTGKMPYIAKDVKFFPAALPADGTIDMILTDTRTPLHKITPILLSLDKGTHVLEPEVIHSKITAYKLIPKIKNTVISVDGEHFPLEPLQVEIIPGLLKTLLRNGSYIDTEFDAM